MLKIKKNNLILLGALVCVSCGDINYEARTRYRKKSEMGYKYYKNEYYGKDLENNVQSNNEKAGKKPEGYEGYYKIGNPYKINGKTYYPAENRNYKEIGWASWYGQDFHAKKTANGETFDMNSMTAAHKTLPLPSMVKVTNLENGKSIVVRVNDRGPFVEDRIIDLSRKAAEQLESKHKGLIKVKVEFLKKETDRMLKEYGLKQ